MIDCFNTPESDSDTINDGYIVLHNFDRCWKDLQSLSHTCNNLYIFRGISLQSFLYNFMLLYLKFALPTIHWFLALYNTLLKFCIFFSQVQWLQNSLWKDEIYLCDAAKLSTLLMIRVRIYHPHPHVCRKRRISVAVLWMRPEKPRSCVAVGIAQ
jgi:hypothetical protein